MKMEPLFTIRAELRQADVVGPAPSGLRAIAEVTGGTFEGQRLRGSVLTPGADWALVSPDGWVNLDVRLTLRTDDDALVYMTYTGVMEPSDKGREALAGGPETSFGDLHFLTQPRFECGNESYAWLNHVVAVAEGRLLPGAVEYAVYECLAG